MPKNKEPWWVHVFSILACLGVMGGFCLLAMAPGIIWLISMVMIYHLTGSASLTAVYAIFAGILVIVVFTFLSRKFQEWGIDH